MENNTIMVVKSQEEFDMIPNDFKGRVVINVNTTDKMIIVNRAFVFPVLTLDNSHVEAHNGSYVEACENSRVVALDNSRVEAYNGSYVEACENSYVAALDNSRVEAYNGSCVEARDRSYIEAHNGSYVVAWENSHVEAHNSSYVEAHNSSYVVAWENSHVEAHDNSQIENHQATNGIMKIYGNARIIRNPKTIEEYMSFYGLKHDKKKGIFYKAVRRYDDGTYHSNYDENFMYSIGETIKEECDPDANNNYSFGINVAHLSYALKFGQNWGDLAILEVESDLDKIIVPFSGRGNVRTSEIHVIREVPLEECGIYGKIIIKSR